MIRRLVRSYGKRLVDTYYPNMTVERAQKWVLINRTIYFFSATTLFIYVFAALSEYQRRNQGVGEDEIEERARAPLAPRLVQVYVPGKGWTMEEQEDSGIDTLTPVSARQLREREQALVQFRQRHTSTPMTKSTAPRGATKEEEKKEVAEKVGDSKEAADRKE